MFTVEKIKSFLTTRHVFFLCVGREYPYFVTADDLSRIFSHFTLAPSLTELIVISQPQLDGPLFTYLMVDFNIYFLSLILFIHSIVFSS